MQMPASGKTSCGINRQGAVLAKGYGCFLTGTEAAGEFDTLAAGLGGWPPLPFIESENPRADEEDDYRAHQRHEEARRVAFAVHAGCASDDTAQPCAHQAQEPSS